MGDKIMKQSNHDKNMTSFDFVVHMLPRAPQGEAYLAKAVLLRQRLKDAGGANLLSAQALKQS